MSDQVKLWSLIRNINLNEFPRLAQDGLPRVLHRQKEGCIGQKGEPFKREE